MCIRDRAQLAAVAVRQVACDAQAHAVALLLARQAKVRLEHLLELLLGHTWPLVIDMQDERLGVVLDVQVRALAILQSVVQQIADATAQGQRLAGIKITRGTICLLYTSRCV